MDNLIFKSTPTDKLRHMYDHSAHIRFITDKSLKIKGPSAFSSNFVDVHKETGNSISYILKTNLKLDPVGLTVRYEMMKLCTGSV